MTLPEFLTNPDPDLYRYAIEDSVTLDFETTNIETGTALNEDNRIVLACWYDKHGMHATRGGEMVMQELVHACNNASFLIAHNAKFELQWLQRCGFDITTKPVYDTMVAEWVLAGNQPYGILASLDDCLDRRNLGSKMQVVKKMIKAGVCPSDIPYSWLLKYCKDDVRLTRVLMERQLQEMEGTRLLPIVYTRCLTTPALADIEWNGLHLDSDRVEAEYETTLAEYNSVLEEMDALTGGINPNSPPQVAHFVYGKLGFAEKTDKRGEPIRNRPTKQFPDGLPKTDEATLLSLTISTDEQRRFIELKKRIAELGAAINKNLAMFIGACREHDSMIFGQLNQCTTKTHRLSSSGRRTYFKMFDTSKGCQFQNLPRKYKPLFSPRNEGWLMGEADGAQLEFRVAGHIGDDDVIREEIRHKFDVHRYTASIINDVSLEEVTKEQRTAAKAHTFKPLYGGQTGTRAEQRYYQSFQEKYPNLHDTQEGWCTAVEAGKGFETEWGMRFYWPEAKLVRYGGKERLNVMTNVYNIAIQSFATADIIPIALTFFWHRSGPNRIMIVNTVHDSIEAEFPPEERELFETLAVQCLTTDVYEYLDKVYDVQFSVPLGVGILVGKHWGEPLEGEDEIDIQVETPFT